MMAISPTTASEIGFIFFIFGWLANNKLFLQSILVLVEQGANQCRGRLAKLAKPRCKASYGQCCCQTLDLCIGAVTKVGRLIGWWRVSLIEFLERQKSFMLVST